MIVWYHGPVPVDYMGLVARIYRDKKRSVYSVVTACMIACMTACITACMTAVTA